MSQKNKCYDLERDAWELDQAGGYYSRHVMAMTSEGLHSKGDIAAELGYRNMRIDQLEAEWRAQEERAENAETELVDLRDRYSQLEAVAKDFLRRNKYGPLFYRDLYNRFKEIVK